MLFPMPTLDAIEVCYHAGASRGDPCDCRKPKPGMLLRASSFYRIDLRQSFLIGDRWRDVKPGIGIDLTTGVGRIDPQGLAHDRCLRSRMIATEGSDVGH